MPAPGGPGHALGLEIFALIRDDPDMRMDWTRLRVAVSKGVGRVRCEPGWRLGPDWAAQLRDCDLWFVWAGRGRMTLRDRTIELRPGVCLWMRPGGIYLAEQEPADRLGVTYLHFDVLNARGSPLRRDRVLPPEVYEVPDAGATDAILTRIVELRRSADERHHRAADHLLTGVLMELEATPRSSGGTAPGGVATHQRRVVQAAAARIRESPADAPSAPELARAAGYSVDHFAKLFRQVMGQPPQEYIVAARIDRAKQLLAESTLSVAQVADALGYRDVYFFSRQFKQKTGRSPSAYRKRRMTGAEVSQPPSATS